MRGGDFGLVQGYQGQSIQADDLLIQAGINGRVLVKNIDSGISQGQIGLRSRGHGQGKTAEQTVPGLMVFQIGAGNGVKDDGREGDRCLAVLCDLLFQVSSSSAGR